MAEQPLSAVASQKRAAEVQRGTARAAVLGVSDGLVTNVSLILGVSAADASTGFVRLAGLASLAAGACSMAVGEYVSMRAQVELLERLLVEERAKLQQNPCSVQLELQEFIERAGVSHRTAREAARQLARDPHNALGTYARSIGLNPEELGSPWAAAASSFVTFALGAFVPLVPWLVSQSWTARGWSVGLTAFAAIAIGAFLGRLSGRSPVRAGLRQLLVVVIAAAATVGVGRLFKVPVS
jgi:VIT1/CCC1 family predicted Fe2+/Mn2+ transporter